MAFSGGAKKKVIHLIHSMRIGGAENVVLSYAKYHNKASFHMEVCTFKPGGELEDAVEAHGVKVNRLRSSSSNPVGFVKLLFVLKIGRFHIAHFHNPLPVYLGLPASLLTSVKVRVLTEHSVDYPGRLGSGSPVYRLLLRNMDLTLACSEEVMESHISHLDPSRLVVVHNGVDTKKFSPGQISYEFREKLGIVKGTFVVGHVGNLNPQKGQIYLLKAVQKLIANEIPIILLMVGDGPLRSLLEIKARELRITQNVRFLGKRNDVAEILRSVDVVVGASLREGLPISVLEAMAAGKPVVTTNVGGSKEAVLHGVTGFIVPPENSDELALALKKILLDDNLRQRMGDAARQRVEEHFSAQQMVKRTEEIYEKLLRSKQSG